MYLDTSIGQAEALSLYRSLGFAEGEPYYDTPQPLRDWLVFMRLTLLGSGEHNGYMGRIIGTILSAILAIWLVMTVAGGILATFKSFLIIALIAMAVFIVVWLVARGSRRSSAEDDRDR
jgi:predicted lipid-binding transport protein (Tim44 family)